MFNLNRWAGSGRAPDELAIMKIVYIILLYASTIWEKKEAENFHKNFPPIIVVIFFLPRRSNDETAAARK